MYFSGDTECGDSLAAAKDVDVAFVSTWMYRSLLRRGVRIDAKRIVYHHHVGQRVPECVDTCVAPAQGNSIQVQ